MQVFPQYSCEMRTEFIVITSVVKKTRTREGCDAWRYNNRYPWLFQFTHPQGVRLESVLRSPL